MKSLNGQSIIDLAIQTAGSAAAAYELALANGLSVTDDLTSGAELTSVDVVEQKVLTYFVNKNIKPATDLTQKALIIAGAVDTFVVTPQNYKSVSTIKALANQTSLDIAIQECGSVEAAYDFCIKNGISITDDLVSGTEYKKIPVINGKTAAYFTQRNLKPATGITGRKKRIFARTFSRKFN